MKPDNSRMANPASKGSGYPPCRENERFRRMTGPQKIPLVVASLIGVCFPRDKVGSLLVGADFLPNNEYNETSSGVYKLQKTGISFGFLIPINVPLLDLDYKVKASTHQIDKRGWDWSGEIQRDPAGLYDKHASVLNEILIGKELPIDDRMGILPQIGIGYQLDALNQDGDSHIGGIVYSCLFTDFSSAFRYRISEFGIGAMANYQLCAIPSWDGYEATDRISFSILLFK
jgi:hypothetical protein